ncbi:MAG: DUF6036 family nucleotidyltransferase [Thiolinea sp.]
MSRFYIDTPLAKAIFTLLNQLDETFARYSAGSLRAYIFGGCALHIHTKARGSNDLDVALEAAERLRPDELSFQLDPVYFDDELGLPSLLELDTQFNTALASVSPDYQERAILLAGGERALYVYLVAAVDLAVSKLARLAEDDMQDIRCLFQAGGFTLTEFERVAQSALDYYATPQRLEWNIRHALKELEKMSQ